MAAEAGKSELINTSVKFINLLHLCKRGNNTTERPVAMGAPLRKIVFVDLNVKKDWNTLLE